MRNTFSGLRPGSVLARFERLLTALAVAFPNPGIPTLLSPKRRRRQIKLGHWQAGLMAGAAAFSLATGAVPVGVSATGPTFMNLASQFELDGNINLDNLTGMPCDWGNTNKWYAPGNSNGPEQTPTCATANPNLFDTTGVVKDTFVGGQDPSAFTTGSKDTLNISGWGCTQKPFDLKNNILDAYAASFRVAVTGDGTHRAIYMGQERASNNGDAFAGFWLLHGPATCTPPSSGNAAWSGAHTNGDLLIVSNYTGGGSNNNVDVFVWNNGALDQTPIVVGPDCGINSTAAACTIDNNTAVVPKPDWGPQALDTGEFVETGVDLTAVDEVLAQNGITGINPCFSNFIAETRSSQSATADLHDYAQGRVATCPPATAQTTPTSASITLGQTNSDGITVTGNEIMGSPTGSVDFFVCGPLQSATGCSAGTRFDTKTLTAGSNNTATATSAAFTPTSAGIWCFAGYYLGSDNYGPASDTSPGECFIVSGVSPTLATNASASGVSVTSTSGTVGTAMSIGDTATLSGFQDLVAGDTVTFQLTGPTDPNAASCTTAVGQAITAPVDTTHGTASTGVISWTPSASGTYYWLATFSGDGNNAAITSPVGCGDSAEAVTVVAAAVLPVTVVKGPTPAKTGDWSMLPAVGVPFVLGGLLMLAIARRRREGEV